MQTTVDAGEHIGLIYRVINQLDIRGTDAEEAFSEGLVAITEAAIKYDPERQVPIASWLAKNIRWSLQTWRANQRQWSPIEHDFEAPREPLAARIELKEVVAQLGVLTDLERQVILAVALGYNGLEISGKLGVTTVAVSRAKKKAQAKLREALK